MSGFNDGICVKCGKRMGWTGKITDKPACPKCGHKPASEELNDLQQVEAEIEEQMQQVIARKKSQSDEKGEIFSLCGRVGDQPHSLYSSTRCDDELLYLRFDCKNNPVFWLEAVIHKDQLKKWLEDISQAGHEQDLE